MVVLSHFHSAPITYNLSPYKSFLIRGGFLQCSLGIYDTSKVRYSSEPGTLYEGLVNIWNEKATLKSRMLQYFHASPS
jgi:hypothetical protein